MEEEIFEPISEDSDKRIGLLLWVGFFSVLALIIQLAELMLAFEFGYSVAY